MNKPFGIFAAFLLIFLILPVALWGQREPQNIYRVVVNSRYVIENGERTSKFYAIGQLISDSLGRIHTEIDYNWETRYPDNYRWHYFNGMQKVKTDFFVKEKLSRIVEYVYLPNGLLAEVKVYSVSSNDTTLLVREVYTYGPNGKVSQATGFNAASKRGYRGKYVYDTNGNEILRKVKGKKATPPDSIMFLQRTLTYDANNRVANETKVVEKRDKPRATRIYSFKYNDNGDVTEKLVSNDKNQLIKRVEFVYRRDNRLQQKRVFDSNNNLLDHLAWRYEIYKTDDRRQRVLE
jgi:hypothetical protein